MPVDPRFLECRFHRRLAWKEDNEGRVVVFKPRFGEGKLGRWLASALRLPDYRIRLDEMGTLVWKLCDRKATASQIAERMRRRFSGKVEPAEDRLYDFIMQLKRAGMIEIEV